MKAKILLFLDDFGIYLLLFFLVVCFSILLFFGLNDKCPICGKYVEIRYNYCISCGHDMKNYCDNCESENKSSAKYCAKCGNEL